MARAAELWLESCEAAALERTTLARYREHADLHVIPVLGALRLSQLTVPLVRGFEDRLRRDGRSPAMVRIARRSLGAPGWAPPRRVNDWYPEREPKPRTPARPVPR